MRRVLTRIALQIPAIDRLHRHRNTLLAENARQAAAIASLTVERDGTEAARAELSVRLDKAAAECADLSERLDKAAAERAGLSERIHALVAERDGLLADLRRLRAEFAALSGQRDGLEAERARAAADAAALGAERDRLSTEFARERDRLTREIARLAPLAIHRELIPAGPPVSPAEAIAAASAKAAAAVATSGPLVSIVCVCRNAERFIGRALASMRSQQYPNVELLVQDGGSSDRTLEIAQAVEGASVVSERDEATLDGLLRAARRARGEIIAVCWADDELLPHAVGWAAGMFERHSADIIYGDQLFVFDNRAEWIAEGSPWDRGKFLRQEFFPPFSSSFFRRSALLALAEHLTVFDHDEFEFWLWLDRGCAIRYVPGLVSKFHVHDGSRWTKPGYCEAMVNGRRRAIAKYTAATNDGAALAAAADLGLELWAALHEISCTGSIEQSLKHLERVQDRFDGDPRFLTTLARLLNESKRNGLRDIERILAVAQRLGFDFGILETRRAG